MMRCLTLADALLRRGAAVHFFVNPGAAAHVPALADFAGGYSEVEPGGAAAAAAIKSSGRNADVAVVDHYGMDARDESRLAAAASRIVVIDDLFNRPHDCALLIDQTFGQDPSVYDSLVPADAERLIGSEFAMLRPEFAEARGAALARRERQGPVSRILVSMGLTDVGGITFDIVEALLSLAGKTQLRLDVPIAPRAPSAAPLADLARKYPRLSLHSPAADLVPLMAGADLAIGSAGSTAWERCCLGLPTVMLQLAPNQQVVMANLVRKGAAVMAGNAAEAAAGVLALSSDPERRREIASRAAEVVDGLGVERVADRVMRLAAEG